MLGIPYYNESIKQAVAVFGSLFSSIIIQRKDGKRLGVPIAYGPRDKWKEAQKAFENDIELIEKHLPRMSYELVAMNYDQTRKLGNKHKFAAKGPEQYTKVPVPYNLDFTLYIQTKTLNDGWQIVEQIVPFFTPSYTVRVRNFPFDRDSDTIAPTNEYDMPFTLTALTWGDDWVGDIESRRVIEWSLEFTTKVHIFGPPQSLNPTKVYLGSGGSSGSTIGSSNGACALTIPKGIILDSRVIISTGGIGTSVQTLTRKTGQIGIETGYANVDSEIAFLENDSDISPNVINTIDSDGYIVKIVRDINNF